MKRVVWIGMRRTAVLAAAGLMLFGVVGQGPKAAASVYPGVNGKIVFNQNLGSDSEDFLDSFTVNPDGSNLLQIGPAGITHCGFANEPWSPDGSKVVCIEFDFQADALHTATVNADGSSFSILSNPHLPSSFGCGSWSPDGRSLLCPFTSDGVYTVRPNGKGLLELTSTPAGEGPSGFANDGSHAYFTVQDENEFRTLYSVRTDGTGGLTALSPPTVSVHDNDYFDGVSADSSPVGSRIVFVADVADGYQRALYTVNIDGTGLHRIKLPSGMNPTSAQWSPDGRWIAFSGRPPEAHSYLEVYVIHPNGTGLKEITLPTGECLGFAPIWSPDGSKLLFARRCFMGAEVGSTTLSTVNLDGTGDSTVADLNDLVSYAWGTAPAN
jgi:Tol biopolymer transport system component